MTIRELRESKELSQSEAAAITGLSLRTYQNYEYEKSTRDQFKINQITRILSEYQKYSPEKGILPLKDISDRVSKVCKNHKVHYVYLFGSYSKNKANEKSDVDLFISCDEKGLDYFSIFDELSKSLNKKVDLIRVDEVNDNIEFLNEVLRTGIRIYG